MQKVCVFFLLHHNTYLRHEHASFSSLAFTTQCCCSLLDVYYYVRVLCSQLCTEDVGGDNDDTHHSDGPHLVHRAHFALWMPHEMRVVAAMLIE